MHMPHAARVMCGSNPPLVRGYAAREAGSGWRAGGNMTNVRQKGLTSMCLRVAAADRVMPYMPSCAPCTSTSFPCRYHHVALCCLRRQIHW